MPRVPLSLPWSAQEQYRTGSAQDTGLRFHCFSRSSVPTSAGHQPLPGTAFPHWHTTDYRLAQGYHSTGTNTPAFRVHHIRAFSTVRQRSHAGIAAYALPGRRTLRADEPVVAEAYVYPTYGCNPNSGHLCLSQQWVLHRARFKLNVLQSDSSSRLLSAA